MGKLGDGKTGRRENWAMGIILDARLKANHLQQRYKKDQMIALEARMIPAIAFVPVNDLDVVFTALSNFLPIEFTPLLQWLEESYLGRPIVPAGPPGRSLASASSVGASNHAPDHVKAH